MADEQEIRRVQQEQRSLHGAVTQFLSSADTGAGLAAGGAVVTGIAAGAVKVGKKVTGKDGEKES